MSTIPQLSRALRTTLAQLATEEARPRGFTQRHSKLTGALFVQTLVWGWLAQPQASLSTLAQMAAAVGVRISPQGLAQRFTYRAAALLERVDDITGNAANVSSAKANASSKSDRARGKSQASAARNPSSLTIQASPLKSPSC